MTTTKDGRLWVATLGGAAMLDLSRLLPGAGKPFEYISEVDVDGKKRNADRELILPPGLHHTELQLGSIELSSPQRAQMSDIECIIAIRSDFPNARIIVLTTYPGDVQALRALKAGARGYLLKGQVNRDLPEVIRAVHAGQKRIPPEIAIELAEHTAEDDLSSREIEVLRLIAAGNANKEIASKLRIAEETVKSHVTNILAKLHANDRTHAVTTALKRGIIQL